MAVYRQWFVSTVASIPPSSFSTTLFQTRHTINLQYFVESLVKHTIGFTWLKRLNNDADILKWPSATLAERHSS